MTFNVPRPQMPALPPLNRRARILIAIVVAIILVLIVGSVFVGQFTDLLWFRSVGYSSVFSRRLVTELLLFFVFGTAMAVVVAANVIVAFRLRPPFRPVSQEQEQLERYRRMVQPVRGWVLAAVAVFIGIITGSAASRRWETWLLWRNGTSFGIKDQQFHRDVSYFAFTYPMQRFVLGTLFAIVVVSLIAVLITAYLYGSLRLQTPGPKWTPASRVHISILLGVFLLLKAVAYWLDRFGLAFSGRGIVTGPSYTDVHAVLPAKSILVFVAIICGLLFFANVVTRNWTLPAIALGLMVLSAIVIGGFYPLLVQHYKVQPSAQDLEAPYIQRNINATQIAYGITPRQVTPEQYAGVSTQTPTQQRQSVSKDVQLRVLDPNVVSQTFEQLQQQRSFYKFEDSLDVDRYALTPSTQAPLTDVVIGTREISIGGLQPNQRNWINEHLVYTHGYGVVAAQADSALSDGSPDFIESDLPPTGSLSQIQPKGQFQPRIYFGESSPSYSIVGAPPRTRPRELDLPTDTGTGQINTTYTGGGGVPIGSTLRQLLYAWKFKDKNILLSSGVNSASRLLYIRDPRQRVAKVAPWLTLDGDPYPVVNNGQILWVVDGYTTTDGFPYSEQESLGSSTKTSLNTTTNSVAAQSNTHINYIRNSVKATVNAYTGQVEIYAWNQAASPDPVLKTWEKAFPGVVKSQNEMPTGLQAHLRYPEDLFNIQRTLIAHYHVTNPHAFYNGTEFWNVSYDPTVSGNIPQPSYYLTVSPDGGPTPPVFSLTSPLVSLSRRNLTAYLSVDSQPGPNYGRFTLLNLPANAGLAGPGQVQNELDSNTTISPRLTLLSSGGSKIIKGNMLTVPVDGSMLYVEPLYVQASGGQTFPVLRKFLAYSDGNAAYQSTVGAALDQVFGVKSTTPAGNNQPPPSGNQPPPTGSTALQQAIASAQQAETAAKAALRRGDFAAYGVQEKKLQRALNRIAAAAGTSGAAASRTSATSFITGSGP